MAEPFDVVIMSGAYVGPDLTAEFGALPPAFLPVGMRRLFEAQLEMPALVNARVTLTLPDDYLLSVSDQRLLSSRNVLLHRTAPNLSLLEAVKDTLETLGQIAALAILHGDTLVDLGDRDIRVRDSFAAAETEHYATWADYTVSPDGGARFEEHLRTKVALRSVACGWFEFEDGAAFRDCAETAKDFIDALNLYSQIRPLRPRTVERWFDFGHLQTYFAARKKMLAARAFNSVVASEGVVRKRGSPARKILAEAHWYQNLPRRLRPFTPQLTWQGEPEASGDAASYEMEYLYLPALSEMFAFGDLPAHTWTGILHSCADFLRLCQTEHPHAGQVEPEFAARFFEDLVESKTRERVTRFGRQLEIDIQDDIVINGASLPGPARLAELLAAAVPRTQETDLCRWHGDFHFANILYDFRAQRVRCIDPRGMLSDGSVTAFGDPRYDIAKLTHSVIGLYDLIIADRFALARKSSQGIEFAFEHLPIAEPLRDIYREMPLGRFSGLDREILALTALLFLTMPPLHAEAPRRQLGMLANAYRIASMSGVI